MDQLTEPALLAELEKAAKAPSQVGAETMRQLLEQAIAALEAAPEAMELPPDATVHQRILAVMRAIGAVGKTAEMTEGPRYNYRSIDAILERANPAMARFGLFLAPTVQDTEYGAQTAKGGAAMTTVHLTVEWNVHGMAGDKLVPPVVTVGEAFDTSDKATNKAHTAAFKLALGLLFAIPYSEPDQDAERHELGNEPTSTEPPTEEETAAMVALLDLINHAPAEVVDPLTSSYRNRVWQGREKLWEDCPPKWAPIILDVARKRLAAWEEQQEAQAAAEGHDVNGAAVPSVAVAATEDSADPTLLDHEDPDDGEYDGDGYG